MAKTSPHFWLWGLQNQYESIIMYIYYMYLLWSPIAPSLMAVPSCTTWYRCWGWLGLQHPISSNVILWFWWYFSVPSDGGEGRRTSFHMMFLNEAIVVRFPTLIRGWLYYHEPVLVGCIDEAGRHIGILCIHLLYFNLCSPQPDVTQLSFWLPNEVMRLWGSPWYGLVVVQ